MPERKIARKQHLRTPGQYTSTQTRRVRHVNPQVHQEDSTEESIDAEAALYIKELHEDWANLNLIQIKIFHNQTNNHINKLRRRILGGNLNKPRKTTMERRYGIANIFHKH